MDTFTTLAPISLAPVVLLVAGVSAGIAAMTGRRKLAIALGVMTLVALAGMVLWVIFP